ncbi:MAG: ion transporter [Bacteroidetes bacterium]|nr:MAG: ion transporter [Bacteroidota bacterium]
MFDQRDNKPDKDQLRQRLHTIIFEADTLAGKTFDLILLAAILLSIAVVMLESVNRFTERYGYWFRIIEWVLTILFTIEYLLRIYAVKKPLRYITSFYGIIDFIAILPAYLSIILSGAQMFMVIRAIRLLRVFRILKLVYFLDEARMLARALYSSRGKISVFLFFVVLMVIIIGAIMYLVEGQQNPGFSNIPVSIYWAIVTLTTVGFGDITPQTGLGQLLSAVVMIMGYAVLAVPTGIVTMELVKGQQTNTRACPSCSREGHDDDAVYCKFCGHVIDEQ